MVNVAALAFDRIISQNDKKDEDLQNIRFCNNILAMGQQTSDLQLKS